MPRISLYVAGLAAVACPIHARSQDMQRKDIFLPPPVAQAPVPEPEGAPLPPAVRVMLEEAFAKGNGDEVATIAKYAILANPGSETEIRAMVAQHQALVEAERQSTIKTASLFDLWEGKIELGGFRSTGSSSEFGVSSTLSASRKGLQWEHDLTARVDYRQSNDKTSLEHILASYGPRYHFDKGNFVYGLLQYERDPIVGYDNRYTGSGGIGYTFVSNDKVVMSMTLGPSLRHTFYTDDGRETKFGGRSSLDLRWNLNPALSLQQTASSYIERDTASVASLTALDARIISKLSARLSYNVQYESGSKLTDKAFDTTSKVTLIYDF